MILKLNFNKQPNYYQTRENNNNLNYKEAPTVQHLQTVWIPYRFIISRWKMNQERERHATCRYNKVAKSELTLPKIEREKNQTMKYRNKKSIEERRLHKGLKWRDKYEQLLLKYIERIAMENNQTLNGRKLFINEWKSKASDWKNL